MVGVSASVNLPLQHKVQKFSSGTSSLGYMVGSPGKRTVKWLWWWMCSCVVLGLVVPYQAKRLAWGTSPKWPILCWLGRKTTTQSILKSNFWPEPPQFGLGCDLKHLALFNTVASLFWIQCGFILFHELNKHQTSTVASVIMAAVCNRAGHYIFALWFLSSIYLSIYLSIFFFSLPNLSGRRLDVYHTLTHGVALVRI